MLFPIVFIGFSAQVVFGATIYVSPTGLDTAAGTITAPLKSIQSAIDKAVAGDTIYLRAGTYSPTTNIQIKKSGTASALYTLSAYSTEKVIIDGEGLPYTPADLDASLPSASRGILHIQGASYWKLYGIELINGPYGIYAVDSSYNTYEKLVTRDNYETGFQLQGASAHNTVLYLDSYGNRDPRKNGESADGLGFKEGTGAGNLIKGARLWNNVDDGLDLWEFKTGIEIQDTISWGNGFNRWGFTDFGGDGNGFKLGGGDAADIGAANHIVNNSIAFLNAAKGFTDNSQTGNFVLTRNTAWNNGDSGFKMATAVSTLTSNIAALNTNSQVSLSGTQTQSGNSWNIGGTWNNATFKSVDSSSVTGARASSGKIVGSDFLLPVSGAALGATTYW
ncbi:pectate lyase L [Coleophoma cylindrospora]|uniref:Pectate lyase L n=1 Tax=Coleophoma cylindrospora TaxID=1849047 RepID=A0A3D8SS34_9HELO|nr:pectate lyase L [Coleophoma cylindrospora]